MNFPGQVHKWRVSSLLQKGILQTRETFLQDVALSAHLLFITAKCRIFGNFISIYESARAFSHGIVMLVDMLIGVPSLLAHDLDKIIKGERFRYLVAELICQVNVRKVKYVIFTFII